MDPKIQKIKLMKILEILHRKTDEEHHMNTVTLIRELNKMNITADRRTIYSDIDTMIEWGYEVRKERYGRDMYYWVEHREFDLPELKLIMDAVESSKFIPLDKTDTLLNKIADLGGSARRELLKRSSRHFNVVKLSNPEIYDNIDTIERAVDKGKVITFCYYDLNICGKRVYRHNKQVYREEPISMLANDGNYYLICYRSEEKYINHVKIFRIDRISDIRCTDDDISQAAADTVREISNFPRQVFKMYGGEITDVTLEFDEGMTGVIFNKFGEETLITEYNSSYTATVQVQLSPTFWGWLTQFAGKICLVAPESAKESYMEHILQAITPYVRLPEGIQADKLIRLAQLFINTNTEIDDLEDIRC